LPTLEPCFWEYNLLLKKTHKKKLEKLLIKYSKSNAFQRFSNTMPNGSFVKRWDIKMKAYLKKSKERSKFVFG
jgi:hypothetical protein